MQDAKVLVNAIERSSVTVLLLLLQELHLALFFPDRCRPRRLLAMQ
jgi:hypothetical protein